MCIIRYGNILKADPEVLCVTTNGFVTNGDPPKCVMGIGIAKQIKELIPDIDCKLGELINKHGNIVLNIFAGDESFKPRILSLPVKPDYTEANSDLSNIVRYARKNFKPGDTVPGFLSMAQKDIIERSLIDLMKHADIYEYTDIALPRPGCGAGGLPWEDIYPLCDKILDDRFTIYTYKPVDRTVFISGSRSISNLTDEVKALLIKYIVHDWRIILGDCKGVDKLVHDFLDKKGYTNTVVYHIGDAPRYEVSDKFTSRKITGSSYTDKDIAMANECSEGLIIWDGISKGSMNNVKQLSRLKKKHELVLIS